MKDNSKHLLLVTLISFCSFAYSQDKIEFQIVATGQNAGFASCSPNHIIESEPEFSAFCDSISLNSSLLSYRPDFESVQIVGIVYGQSIQVEGHSIKAINSIGDTVWVEINYSIPTIPSGLIPQPAYKYQIVAIPRQSKPISFRLIQLTSSIRENSYYRSSVRVQYPELNSEYDLSGRLVRKNTVQSFSVLRLIRNGSMLCQKRIKLAFHK